MDIPGGDRAACRPESLTGKAFEMDTWPQYNGVGFIGKLSDIAVTKWCDVVLVFDIPDSYPHVVYLYDEERIAAERLLWDINKYLGGSFYMEVDGYLLGLAHVELNSDGSMTILEVIYEHPSNGEHGHHPSCPHHGGRQT